VFVISVAPRIVISADLTGWRLTGMIQTAYGRVYRLLEPGPGGRYALLTAGAVEMKGGIPLLSGSEIIGAIGISGAR
jgi:uncharacterized protein GlcG (DUF336 family)